MTFEPNATAAGAQRQAPTIRNFDHPEVAETFADAITSLVFVLINRLRRNAN